MSLEKSVERGSASPQPAEPRQRMSPQMEKCFCLWGGPSGRKLRGGLGGSVWGSPKRASTHRSVSCFGVRSPLLQRAYGWEAANSGRVSRGSCFAAQLCTGIDARVTGCLCGAVQQAPPAFIVLAGDCVGAHRCTFASVCARATGLSIEDLHLDQGR